MRLKLLKIKMYNDVFYYGLCVVLLHTNIYLQSSLILIWLKPL